MALPGVENYTTTTADGIEVGLARYRGGAKGPVMVVHGAGVWSGMFLLPTIEEHFTQYLVNHGYDVWLLDWRASIRLPLRQFNSIRRRRMISPLRLPSSASAPARNRSRRWSIAPARAPSS